MSKRSQRPLFLRGDDLWPRPVMERSRKDLCLPSVEDLEKVVLKSSSTKTTTELHGMIVNVQPFTVKESNQWRAIQLRCQTNPEEASRLDRRGRSCLHAACAKKPPIAVTNAILSACDTSVLLERDNHGRTPLAIAIASNATLHVIETLLRANTKAAKICDRLGKLPLHLACGGYDYGNVQLVRLLLRVYPEGAQHETLHGRTPFHSAIESGAPVELIEALLQVFPKNVLCEGCGSNPLFMAIELNASLDVIQALVRADPQVTRSRDCNRKLPLRRAMEKQCSTAIVRSLCTSPELVTDVDSHMENTALHAAFECGVPRPSVVRLLLTTAPQVSTQACRSGHTPLTLACQKYISLLEQRDDHPQLAPMWENVSMLAQVAMYGSNNAERNSKLLEGDEFFVHAAVSTILPKDIVLIALRLLPDQIRTADVNGRYPLYLALEGPYRTTKRDILMELLHQYPEAPSRCFANGRYMLSVASNARCIAPETIDTLITANPGALRQIDRRHGLYPFQVAALEKDDSNSETAPPLHPRIRNQWDPDVDEDLFQTSAIFQLLLAAPDLLQSLRHHLA